jgi:hypothetical protein
VHEVAEVAIDAARSLGPMKMLSTPGTAAIFGNCASAATVSICTIRKSSSAARFG